MDLVGIGPLGLLLPLVVGVWIGTMLVRALRKRQSSVRNPRNRKPCETNPRGKSWVLSIIAIAVIAFVCYAQVGMHRGSFFRYQNAIGEMQRPRSINDVGLHAFGLVAAVSLIWLFLSAGTLSRRPWALRMIAAALFVVLCWAVGLLQHPHMWGQY